MILTAGLMVVLLGAASPCPAAEWIWAKGNLHTHTTNSDGDSEPQVVADWYKDHGYQFLSITDHGRVTDPTPLDEDPNDGFVLFGGEELGVKGAKPPIHGNALGISQTIDNAEKKVTPARSLAGMVEHIRNAGGIPQVNHPNFVWSFGHRELASVNGPYLLEVFNGHPSVNNAGDEAFLQVEQTWDILLSWGKTVYATATDDAHSFKNISPGAANPGRGWVVVRAPELAPQAILASLAKGDFYASTGVELEDYSFDDRELRVRVAPEAGKTYLIRFVGKWGEILQETAGTSAAYRAPDKVEPNSYIRCKVISSDGKVAWTQAHRVKSRLPVGEEVVFPPRTP
jgi:hypothetical protein